MMQVDALVIGGGPAGLMAAEVLAEQGRRVLVAEAKPSLGRKFLMAGKSGLNLTKAEAFEPFMAAYEEASDWLRPSLEAFGADAIQDWARGLGVTLFTGSTGRVFPSVMKASPLLRAWVRRLDGLGVTFRTRWRWCGWDGAGNALFRTPEGEVKVASGATVLALGGASWRRLGSDGEWSAVLNAKGVETAPFAPANAGLRVDWSLHMSPHFGKPLKNVAFRAGGRVSRGEAVLSERGLEGGGIYSVSRSVREGADLYVDLLPDLSVEAIAARLEGLRRKESMANRLRKGLRLGPVRMALLNEFQRQLPTQADELAKAIKALQITHAGLRPMDEAISTAGGVIRGEVDSDFMLNRLPGVFCAGEMLDWEAPTGGYLLSGCLSTGCAAGQGAAQWLERNSVPRSSD